MPPCPFCASRSRESPQTALRTSHVSSGSVRDCERNCDLEPTSCARAASRGGKTCRYYGAGLRDEVFLAKVLRAGSSSYTPFERFTFVADSQFEDSLRAAHGRVVSLDDSHRSPSFTVLHGAPVRPPPW